MRKHTKYNAFTLIEVLIALVILAIALTAILTVTASSVRNTASVTQRMSAHWIAMNVVARTQAGLLAMPSPGQPVQGAANMLHFHGRWKIYREGKASQYFTRIGVDVLTGGKRITHMNGFIRLKRRAGQV